MDYISFDTAWQLRHDRREHVLEEFATARRRRRRVRRHLFLVRGSDDQRPAC